MTTPGNPVGDIRRITVDQLAALGVSRIAYVRPVEVDGTAAFAIHAADGTLMAIADDLGVALEAVNRHEMLPTLVH